MNLNIKTEIIADGSCLGNPGPGGWAAILRKNGQEEVLTGGENPSTNNRMELTAVISALSLTKNSDLLSVKTDSRYVIDGFEKGWVANWKRNGWRTASGQAVKNKELWEALYALVSLRKITWIWVKGHSGDPDNERVDELARNYALKMQ